MATLIRIDRNGTKYWAGMVACDRCGGAGGADVWKFTGWKCYKCGGTGKVQGTWKEYTPEYAAKLEAKRQAQWEAQKQAWAEEEAKREAERKAKEEAEAKAKAEEEARRAAQKAISNFVGAVGEKIEFDGILEKNVWFDVPSFRGYGTDTMHIYIFRDANGNALVWKTNKGLGIENGTRVHVKGAIKDHNEYDSEKQTVLTRCKVEV